MGPEVIERPRGLSMCREASPIRLSTRLSTHHGILLNGMAYACSVKGMGACRLRDGVTPSVGSWPIAITQATNWTFVLSTICMGTQASREVAVSLSCYTSGDAFRRTTVCRSGWKDIRLY